MDIENVEFPDIAGSSFLDRALKCWYEGCTNPITQVIYHANGDVKCVSCWVHSKAALIS